MTHSITSIHVRSMTDIHPNVRTPRTADDTRVGAKCRASHVGHVGVGSWREEGVTLVEERWVRMSSGTVQAASFMHSMSLC